MARSRTLRCEGKGGKVIAISGRDSIGRGFLEAVGGGSMGWETARPGMNADPSTTETNHGVVAPSVRHAVNY